MKKYEQYAEDLFLVFMNDYRFYSKAVSIEHRMRALSSKCDVSKQRKRELFTLAQKCANQCTAKYPESYHNDGMTCAYLMNSLAEEFSTMEF